MTEARLNLDEDTLPRFILSAKQSSQDAAIIVSLSKIYRADFYERAFTILLWGKHE